MPACFGLICVCVNLCVCGYVVFRTCVCHSVCVLCVCVCVYRSLHAGVGVLHCLVYDYACMVVSLYVNMHAHLS